MHFPLFLFSLLFHLSGVFPARTTPTPTLTTLPTVIPLNLTATWHNFPQFVDLHKGTNVTGISDLKKYFHRFGYLHAPSPETKFSDDFDTELETAILSYQNNLGLPVTGKLDTDTVDLIMSPRCGLGDNHTHEFAYETKRFAYFSGRPRWVEPKPMTLTYAFDDDHLIAYIAKENIRSVFTRAFRRWSEVIPVNFTEVSEYRTADIKIGFHKGDHGDGEPFDGVLGVLAHAFSPENGRLHLDGDETWAVDFDQEKSSVAVDLESVATHEIGHVLGLAHSSVKDAIMYPSLRPRSKKVDLRVDDVEGVQALYGSNPKFNYGTLLESDETSDGGAGAGGGGGGLLSIRGSLWIVVILSLI